MNQTATDNNHDPRENAARYLPLDRRRATRFLDDWAPLVAGVLNRMRVRDPEEAMSKIFQRALVALPGFRGESKLSTWLYRIAWREGLRLAGQQKRRQSS